MPSPFYVAIELTLILSLFREGEEKYPTQAAGELFKIFCRSEFAEYLSDCLTLAFKSFQMNLHMFGQ